MASTLTPNSGPLKLNPTLPVRAAPATPTAAKADPPPRFFDPRLTPGQTQVFRAERGRLVRMLHRRDDGRTIDAVLVLLEDLAEQAPAVDDELARENARRAAAEAARPRLASVLSKRGEGPPLTDERS